MPELDVALPSPGPRRESVHLGLSRFDVSRLDLPSKGQDAHLVRDHFVAVADGASPQQASQGAVVARFAGDALERLHDLRRWPLQQQFARAIGAVGGRFSDRTTPSCGVGLVQLRGSHLEVAVLADLVVVVRTEDRVHTLTDDRVGVYDRRTEAELARRMAAGDDFAAARAAVRPLISDQFDNHRNREGGYWMFANDPAAATQVRSLSLPAAQVHSVLVCSDGYARLSDTFGVVASHAELLRASEEHGVAAMGERLRRLEERPDSVRQHPRTSVHDDATAVLLVRQPTARGRR